MDRAWEDSDWGGIRVQEVEERCSTLQNAAQFVKNSSFLLSEIRFINEVRTKLQHIEKNNNYDLIHWALLLAVSWWGVGLQCQCKKWVNMWTSIIGTWAHGGKKGAIRDLNPPLLNLFCILGKLDTHQQFLCAISPPQKFPDRLHQSVAFLYPPAHRQVTEFLLWSSE